MVEASLKELIKTGHFGSIRLGMSREQVEGFLGAPDDWGGTSRKYRKATILKYGDVEFHFDPNANDLVLIHADHFDVPSGGRSIDLDPWIIRQSLTLTEAEEHLFRNGIDYEVIDRNYEDNEKFIVAGVGVEMLFTGEDARLRAVLYHIPPII